MSRMTTFKKRRHNFPLFASSRLRLPLLPLSPMFVGTTTFLLPIVMLLLLLLLTVSDAVMVVGEVAAVAAVVEVPPIIADPDAEAISYSTAAAAAAAATDIDVEPHHLPTMTKATRKRNLQQQNQQQQQQQDELFELGYKLYIQVTAEHPDVQSAIDTLRTETIDEVNTFVQEEVSDGDVQLNVDYAGITGIEKCAEFDINKYKDYDECYSAIDTIRASTGDNNNIDPNVVERVILDQVHLFLEQFNSRHDDILVEFAYPVFITAAVPTSLLGTKQLMSDAEQSLFLDTFNTGFGIFLTVHSHDPAMTLKEGKILFQQVPTITTESGMPDRRVVLQLFVRAACNNEKNQCHSGAAIEEFLTTQGNDDFAPTFLLALQAAEAAASSNSDYFSSVNRVVFGRNLTEYQPQQAPPVYDPGSQQGEIPYWIWIVLGVNIIIWLVAMVWAAYKQCRRNNVRNAHRRRKEEDMREREPAIVVQDSYRDDSHNNSEQQQQQSSSSSSSSSSASPPSLPLEEPEEEPVEELPIISPNSRSSFNTDDLTSEHSYNPEEAPLPQY